MAAPAFTLNRAEVVDRNFVTLCQERAGACEVGQPRRPLHEAVHAELPWLTGQVLRELFESQITSRLLDLYARELRKQQCGYYTIGSSGHEGNAALGRFARYSDPAFLHYRSGALLVERARQVAGQNVIRDTLLSFRASRLDPISGGRHKVWGSVPLCVPPQTSTIASHLPKSAGAALALERARRLKRPLIFGAHGEIPADSLILCNFGDASANHSVSQGAFNLCSYAAYQNLPIPVLWVCEDNGIGISVHTASGWIEANFSHRPGLRYIACDGLDLVDACRGVVEAVEYVRASRRPAFLHMKTVRLMGHAGTDPETEYHSLAQIEAAEAQDPLLASARLMMDSGYLRPDEVLELYEETRARIRAEDAALLDAPLLTSAADVVAPLAPYPAERVLAEAVQVPEAAAREFAFALDSTPGFLKSVRAGTNRPEAESPAADAARRLPEDQPPRHMAVLINWALRDLCARYPDLLIFGEDVAARGGVYYVTAGLSARFGLGRVFNTLLDETSILGMALGAAHLGLLPLPEIQYLAYLHNAIDQLRGEACSTSFFSNGQFPNGMVVRIQALGYQKGFGGHFHNDNSIAALRDIPGLIVAVPARGSDAVQMLRTCVALARVAGRVVTFLEPIALYMTKDLHETGDGLWLCRYPAPGTAIALGEGAVYRWDGRGFQPRPCGQGFRPAPGGRPAASRVPGGSNESLEAGLAAAAAGGAEPPEDLTILTYGNGVYMSLRAARVLREQHGVAVRVVDLRWLSPLNDELIVQQARATGRVLVVDEGRYSGGVSEAILALLLERLGGRVECRRLTGLDTYIPLGPAANLVLPTEEDVVREALALAALQAAG